MFLFLQYKKTSIYLFCDDSNLWYGYDVKTHKRTNKFIRLDDLRDSLRLNSKNLWN